MADLSTGVIVVAIAIGCLYGAAYGWLAFGIALILVGVVRIIVGDK